MMSERQVQASPVNPFRVEGHIRQELLDTASGEVTETSHMEFAVVVTGRRFAIRTSKKTALQPGEVSENFTGTDESGVLYTISGPVTDKDSTMVVYPGCFPWAGLVHEDALWLAYCSASCLDSTNKPAPVRIPYLLNEYTPGESRQIVERFQAAPSLPFKVRVFSPPYTRLRSVSGTETKVPLKAPFNQGYLMTEFVVSAHTNVGSSLIPTEFNLTNWMLTTRPGGQQDVQKRLTLSVSATSVTAAADEADLQPQMTQPVRVYDARFYAQTSNELITYVANSSAVLKETDPAVTAGLKAKLRELARRGQSV